MYTDSPAALRCKTDPFQRSRLSDPEAPSSTSVTAEGAQTASVSHLYGTPRALPLRCGPAKLGYDPWPACHRLGLARNAPRGRGQCISRPGSHPSTAVAGGPSRDVLCTRCTRSHAVKSDRSFQYKIKPDSHNAQQSRIARHAPPTLPALKACRRTEEAPCWVTTGVAHVDAGHHTCRSHDRPTAQGRLRATPRPSGSAVCMHTSDASESQTCPILGAALTDANFTLRARDAPCSPRTTHVVSCALIT